MATQTISPYAKHLPPDLFKEFGGDEGIKKKSPVQGFIILHSTDSNVILSIVNKPVRYPGIENTVWLCFENQLIVSTGNSEVLKASANQIIAKTQLNIDCPLKDQKEKTKECVESLLKQLKS